MNQLIFSSLADQAITSSELPSSNTLAIALGANLPSKVGSPASTLKAIRPEIKKTIHQWIQSLIQEISDKKTLQENLRWRWSPLFETLPIGGPSNQPSYINAVVLIDGPIMTSLVPSESAALNLLAKLLQIEQSYGRNRSSSSVPWGPRTLDIDLIAWGGLQVNHKKLILPHPRLIERSFVITPLAAALNLQESEPQQVSLNTDW